LAKEEVKPLVIEELKQTVEHLIHLELVDLAREKKRWCGNYPSQKQKQKIKA
jgi:hypothetical protein